VKLPNRGLWLTRWPAVAKKSGGNIRTLARNRKDAQPEERLGHPPDGILARDRVLLSARHPKIRRVAHAALKDY